MADMYLYAELLIHIRQLTLYGSLSEGKKFGGPGSTKLLLAPNNKIITAVHEGESARIYLPSKISGTAGVTLPTGKRPEFSARLTLGDTSELEKVVDGREEGIEAPWSAADLDDGCEVSSLGAPAVDASVDKPILKGSPSATRFTPDVLMCEKCSTFLGTVSGDESRNGYRLFKSALSVQRQRYEASVFIGAQLLHLIQNSISRRVVIHAAITVPPPEDKSGQGILAWVFIPDIYYASSQSASNPFFVRAMKVMYKVIDNPLEVLDAPTSAVEELALPAIAYTEFKMSLESSAKILPHSARRFKMGSDEWKVGLVERWEKTPSGRSMVDENLAKIKMEPAPADVKTEMKEGAERPKPTEPPPPPVAHSPSRTARRAQPVAHSPSRAALSSSRTAVLLQPDARHRAASPRAFCAPDEATTPPPAPSTHSIRSIHARPPHPTLESTQAIIQSAAVSASASNHGCIQSPGGPDRARRDCLCLRLLQLSAPAPRCPCVRIPARRLHLRLPRGTPNSTARVLGVRAAAVEAYRRFGHKQLDPDCAQQPNNSLPVCRYPTAYIMSNSPPAERDVEQSAQSGEEQDQMDREQEGAHGSGLGDFEVKEQDRWLPIANGTREAVFSMPSAASSPSSPGAWAPSGPGARTAGRALAASDANIRNFAPVARIMKLALPDNAKIAKEAKECMQECVSEFISFITSEASEKCQQEKRKTVNGEDILFAMTSLGFENYAEALKIYLSKYRETQSTRGENQGRPTSSGGGYQAGAPGSNSAAAASAGTYPAGQSENANSLLSPSHGLDGSDHDTTASYGYPAAVPAMSGEF
ncbi:hypothetical protein DV737_g2659, partial [Chaetothyriales sp. CBS 132003]